MKINEIVSESSDISTQTRPRYENEALFLLKLLEKMIDEFEYNNKIPNIHIKQRFVEVYDNLLYRITKSLHISYSKQQAIDICNDIESLMKKSGLF